MHDDQRIVDAAIDELERWSPGVPSGPAVRRLVSRVRPVVTHRVANALNHWACGLPNLRSVIEDHVQHVFGALFAERAAYLRRWRPTGGASLRGWVGRFAERRMLDVLRSRRRDLRRHQAMPPSYFARLGDERRPDQLCETLELWERIRATLSGELTAQGRDLFERLVVCDESPEAVMAATQLRPAAIRQWRCRLRARLREVWVALATPGDVEGGGCRRRASDPLAEALAMA
ncbi:MAG: hypothetical protein AAF602_08565 [Myxococcota bacterium]